LKNNTTEYSQTIRQIHTPAGDLPHPDWGISVKGQAGFKENNKVLQHWRRHYVKQ
jgi:hypothetical protein